MARDQANDHRFDVEHCRMPSICTRASAWIIVAFVMLVSTGCVDGPLFTLKKLNPYYQSQWKEDRKKGVVFRQRVEEMRLAREQMPSMSSDEQTRWAKIISDVFDHDTSPEMRREAVMTLALCPDPLAEQTLIRACTDPNEKVRLAACQALSSKPTVSASKMLATIAQTDKSNNIRAAAVRGLGNYPDEDAKVLLRKSLDEKSLAVQFAATEALKTMTGRDFQGDVTKWRQFMDGETVDEPPSNIARQLNESLNILR